MEHLFIVRHARASRFSSKDSYFWSGFKSWSNRCSPSVYGTLTLYTVRCYGLTFSIGQWAIDKCPLDKKYIRFSSRFFPFSLINILCDTFFKKNERRIFSNFPNEGKHRNWNARLLRISIQNSTSYISRTDRDKIARRTRGVGIPKRTPFFPQPYYTYTAMMEWQPGYLMLAQWRQRRVPCTPCINLRTTGAVCARAVRTLSDDVSRNRSLNML